MLFLFGQEAEEKWVVFRGLKVEWQCHIVDCYSCSSSCTCCRCCLEKSVNCLRCCLKCHTHTHTHTHTHRHTYTHTLIQSRVECFGEINTYTVMNTHSHKEKSFRLQHVAGALNYDVAHSERQKSTFKLCLHANGAYKRGFWIVKPKSQKKL